MRLLWFLLILCTLISCRKGTVSKEFIQNEIEYLLHSSFVDVAGVSVALINEHQSFAVGNGFMDRQRQYPLKVDAQYRIASITKTFIAATLIRMHELGKVSINDPISEYISQKHSTTLIEGGYNPQTITILECIQHVSGLFDYAFGKYDDKSSPYVVLASKDPSKIWSRTEQLKIAMEWGKPIPKGNFHYSDTGYILLGEIIENVSGNSLGEAVSIILQFEKLGFENTFFEQEDTTTLELVGSYFGLNDFTSFHPSIDSYGGGGLVSTSSEIAKFYFSLFNGSFFEKGETLELLYTKPTPMSNHIPDKDYRSGFEVFKIYDEEVYVHHGVWNSIAIYIPKVNTAIALNFTEKGSDYLIKKIIYHTLKSYDSE